MKRNKEDEICYVTRAEADVVRSALAGCTLPSYQLITLPDWLLTADVLSAQLERDATLLTLLPDRLLTKEAVHAAIQADNFKLHMCPEHLLDESAFEAYASAHATLKDVPRDMLTERVVMAAVSSMSETARLDDLPMIPEALLTGAVMEKLLDHKQKGENLLIYGVTGCGPFYNALWRYVVSHDTPGTRAILRNCIRYESIYSCDRFFKALLGLDYEKAIELTDFHRYPDRKLSWKVLIAMGELHPSKMIGFLSANLLAMESYLKTSGDRLGPELTAAMSEIRECQHAL